MASGSGAPSRRWARTAASRASASVRQARYFPSSKIMTWVARGSGCARARSAPSLTPWPRTFGLSWPVPSTRAAPSHRASSAGQSIDCGFHQGKRDESRRRNAHLPQEVLGADAVILTHAHIDHSGSLPTLVKAGYGGAIYSTTATRDLCAYLLRDSARIQESDAKWL